MEVLNKKERSSAFLLFLLMVVLSFGILIIAVFFSYKLPWKENHVLRQENKKLQFEFGYQKRFIDALEGIDQQIDSLDSSKEDFIFLDKSISSDLVAIRSRIPKDSLDDRKMYENMILTYKKLLDSKRDLKQVEAAKNDIDYLNDKIKDYEKEIENLNRALRLSTRLNQN